jgi:hypothetical protein
MDTDEDTPSRRPRGGRAGSVRWSPGLGRAICARVAGGELLYEVLREAGMPQPQTVARWARQRAGFGRDLRAARRAGGRSARGGGVWSYCQATAEEVFERLCEGESLTRICRDPTMPCQFTVYHWRRRFPEFAEALRAAREIQAEQLCDTGWEMATEATPETAYLTHVRLTQLRWMTGVMAPRAYRLKAVEPAAADEPLRVLLRTFKIERDPVSGRDKVVALCPNPDTGEAEREDAPGWRPPPNSQPLPG